MSEVIPPDDDLFEVPVPAPLAPLGGHGERDVVFFAHTEPPGGDRPPARDHEDIMLRRVPVSTARRFRAAAGGRGLTHAQYLAALVQLHEAMRRRADDGDKELADQLEALGLSSITI